MNAPPPSVVINRLKKERRLWEEKLGKELEEKQAVGRYAVADRFATHCNNVDNATQALAMAWNDTMEGSWNKIHDEKRVLQEQVKTQEQKVDEWVKLHKEAQDQIQELKAKDRSKQTLEAEAKVETLRQNFERIKLLFIHQVDEKDKEIEELRNELVKTKLENKQITQTNVRLTKFMEDLETKGGEIKLMSKELQQCATRRTEECAMFNNLSAKYESLACRFQTVAAERLALREQLSSITGSDVPLVSLGGLEKINAPTGCIRRVDKREVEWRVCNFHSEMHAASDSTLLFSDLFEMDGIEFRLEVAPRSGNKPAAAYPFIRFVNPEQERRIAFALSVGERTFTAQAPLRQNEGRPWVHLDAVAHEIDRDGVIVFTFELIEICSDEVIIQDDRATWFFPVGGKTSEYDQPGVSLGVSQPFSISGIENLQLEFFPSGEEDSRKEGCACHVIVPCGLSFQYEMGVIGSSEAAAAEELEKLNEKPHLPVIHGTTWGSMVKPYQRLRHSFAYSVGDDPFEVTFRIAPPKENA